MKILHILDHSLPIHTGYTLRTREIVLHQRAMGWQTAHLTSPRANPGEAARETVGELSFLRTPAPAGPLRALPGLWPLAEMRATRARLDEAVREDMKACDRIIICACGTSWHAAMVSGGYCS